MELVIFLGGLGTRVSEEINYIPMDVTKVGKKIEDISLTNEIGPINLCSGTPITVRQLVEKIAAEYGRKDLLRFGVREDNLFDLPSVIVVSNVQ
jgi:dTDP-6-deoxy-L-talose 4-dehydrogenase (NAD+)